MEKKWIVRVCAAALFVPVGLPCLAWLALRTLQFAVTPPYQVKIVNPTSHRIENVVLRPSWSEPIFLGDYEPGGVRTFKTRLGYQSIYLNQNAQVLKLTSRAKETAHTAIPLQGSGTFGLEAALGTATPRGCKVLAAVNGAYGRRLVQMAQVLEIDVAALEFPEDTPVSPAAVGETLEADRSIDLVCACHCETATGIISPAEAVGAEVRATDRRFPVDAMSSFGAVPLNVETAHIGYLISSANKCIEGVPGFSFVVARLAALEQTTGQARS